jgi:hypothetical protein
MVREEGKALLLLSQSSHMGVVVLPEVVNDWILKHCWSLFPFCLVIHQSLWGELPTRIIFLVFNGINHVEAALTPTENYNMKRKELSSNMHYQNHHPYLLHPVHPHLPDDGPTSPPHNLPVKEMTCNSQLHSTLLALAHQNNLLPLALTLVSVLNVQKVSVKRSLTEDA